MFTITGADLGKPPAGPLYPWAASRLLGVIEVGNLVYAFVLVNWSDGSAHGTTTLCCRICNNGVWQDWVSLGAPPAQLSGQAAPPPDILFDACGQGAVVATPDGGIFVFVTGGDGQLYGNCWNGAAWTWVWMGAPPGLTIQFVDNALASPFGVSVKASDGTCWFNAFSATGGQWGLIPAGTFFSRTNSTLSLNPASAFFVMFQINTNGDLVCGEYVMAGIATSGMVTARFGTNCDNQDGEFMVRGINPDGSHVQSRIFLMTYPPDGSRYMDLTVCPEFLPGAFCWLYVTGLSYTGVQLLKGAPASLPDKESEANFNYAPGVADSGVEYTVSAKSDGTRFWASFSACSQFP